MGDEINLADIEAAAARIAPYCLKTPLLESEALNARVGGRLLVKAECLQKAGSFKLRGAVNRLLQLGPEERERGVVAFSSGNHGVAVAATASWLGISATIVMPADVPSAKMDKCREFGGKVVTYDRLTEDRAAIGKRIAEETGAILVPPYDDPQVIAGAGTLSLEILEQFDQPIHTFLTPCSGGGMTAGCALALAQKSPVTKVYAVEPEGHSDTRASITVGARVTNEPGGSGFCDSLLAVTPGEMTFPINQRYVHGSFVVTDDQVREAMVLAQREFGLVVEPGGAVALAAALQGELTPGTTTVVILSGRNVDLALFAKVMTRSTLPTRTQKKFATAIVKPERTAKPRHFLRWIGLLFDGWATRTRASDMSEGRAELVEHVGFETPSAPIARLCDAILQQAVRDKVSFISFGIPAGQSNANILFWETQPDLAFPGEACNPMAAMTIPANLLDPVVGHFAFLLTHPFERQKSISRMMQILQGQEPLEPTHPPIPARFTFLEPQNPRSILIELVTDQHFEPWKRIPTESEKKDLEMFVNLAHEAEARQNKHRGSSN